MTKVTSVTTAVLVAAVAAAGCLGAEEDVDDPELEEEEAAARLPEPSLWRVAPEPLDLEARRRQIDVDRYIRETLYRGYAIVDTTQTYQGTIIDWVDPDSVPGSEIEPPPPIPAARLALPDGVELQRTELDEHPELRGPAGTIPITRPDFAAYVRGASGAGSVAEYVRRGQPGAAGKHRYFAGYRTNVSNTGADAFINQSINAVEPWTFSVLEQVVQTDGAYSPTTGELVGVAVSKDRANFWDGDLPHLRVEFLSAGMAQGDFVGGWDGRVKGFVPAAGRPYGPNVTLTPSQWGGTQRESHVLIQNWYGNWWIAHNGNWLGYYPGHLFDLIHYRAEWAKWYGEVYDPTPSSWTTTDMGSGFFPVAGYRWAAHIRNPFYYSGANAYWPASWQLMADQNALCYSQSAVLTAGTGWEKFFYLGGPGRDGYGCY